MPRQLVISRPQECDLLDWRESTIPRGLERARSLDTWTRRNRSATAEYATLVSLYAYSLSSLQQSRRGLQHAHRSRRALIARRACRKILAPSLVSHLSKTEDKCRELEKKVQKETAFLLGVAKRLSDAGRF